VRVGTVVYLLSLQVFLRTSYQHEEKKREKGQAGGGTKPAEESGNFCLSQTVAPAVLP
jgi:hypothetical protein